MADSLSGVLDDATYNADASASAGSVSYSSPVLTWTGDLAVGATATITYSVTVDDPETGNKIMTNTVTSTAPGNNCPSGSADPACSITVRVVTGMLSITVPARADLGAARPGGIVMASLGTVKVSDDRALADSSWTATVSSTDFTTGAGAATETIPVRDISYIINGLTAMTGSATVTPTAATDLAAAPQPVVANANGDNSASWNPTIQVSVPSGAVAGTYTATIIHSVT